MTRITKTQKATFDAHLEAAKADKFDLEHVSNKKELIFAIENNLTIRGLWNFCWKQVSVTSQLMSSPHIFNHFSGAGINIARGEMKRIMNKVGIDVK